MKKILLLLSALLLAISFASAQTVNNDPTGIMIEDGGSNDGGQEHRSLDVIPIEAAYYASLSSILLTFSCDLGAVTVRVENLTTGSFSQTIIYASTGAQLLPVSNVSGLYEIIFTLPDGHIYKGTFEIE